VARGTRNIDLIDKTLRQSARFAEESYAAPDKAMRSEGLQRIWNAAVQQDDDGVGKDRYALSSMRGTENTAQLLRGRSHLRQRRRDGQTCCTENREAALDEMVAHHARHYMRAKKR